MTKRFIAVVALCSLLIVTGCNNTDQTPPPDTRADAPALEITLGPASSEYPLEDVFKGSIQFAASVENKGDSDITFAHPTICFPASYRIGGTLDFRESHGKSEILLTVEKPDGSVVTLRDGPHFFDPDNESHFVIPPGESDLFYLGWFFQNAHGGWEEDVKAEAVFTGRGQYHLTLQYRNFFPKALVPDEATDASRFIDVWTGELRSNTITVTIE